MKVNAIGRNHWRVTGDLNLASVSSLWQQIVNLISVPGPLIISLSGVQQSSSAGLAILLQTLQVAREHDCELKFQDIPDDLAALASMSNVLTLLEA